MLRVQVANKGVKVMFRFANGFTADSTPPDYVPAGYQNPFAEGPTEEIPSSPPDGIFTLGDITEPKPPSRLSELINFLVLLQMLLVVLMLEILPSI